MDHDIRKRLLWVELFQQSGDAGLTCRRCGISRPTLRKWVQRFEMNGVDGLRELSRRPKTSTNRKVTSSEEGWILDLRINRNLGARRIQNELMHLHNYRLSLATIHKILKRNEAQPLKRPQRTRVLKRYSRPIPGDRVQMDTMKVASGMYQFTAVDDCSRWRVLGLYTRRTATNTLDFLERVCGEMPFPIQRIQTDRGKEFFATKVQARLLEWAIKFRPVKPRSPHLNGKVERSQRTDLVEFWATVDLQDPELAMRLEEWQFQYNWHRPHGSLGGKTPVERVCELQDITPLKEEVWGLFDPAQERFQEANYQLDQRLKKLKRSV